MEDFKKIMEFVVLLDDMKTIMRKTKVITTQVQEDDAQHSYHICAMAVLLERYANGPIDLTKVLKMLLFHDVVELRAGDTFCYDLKANEGKFDREYAAAKELYGMLPNDLGDELFALWLEFEKGESTDAKFAIALDRGQPILNNYFGKGGSWKEHNVSYNQILKRIAPVKEGSESLYIFLISLVDQARNEGWVIP